MIGLKRGMNIDFITQFSHALLLWMLLQSAGDVVAAVLFGFPDCWIQVWFQSRLFANWAVEWTNFVTAAKNPFLHVSLSLWHHFISTVWLYPWHIENVKGPDAENRLVCNTVTTGGLIWRFWHPYRFCCGGSFVPDHVTAASWSWIKPKTLRLLSGSI